ncbi:DUF2529 family protein [Thalassobacillus hwangdonensis]|uniref:DUF2529 family protein n=1 Tax=Thalassobacillus hwangdonensis TaxID=546108 RepID=A0ABW3L4F0_9BACI
MLKMLTTQLTGKFKQIEEKEALPIEDAARSLAQALVGDGHVYVKGFKEMKALEAEMTEGEERLPECRLLTGNESLTPIDRVLIATRYSTDEEALQLVDKVKAQGAEVVALSSLVKNETGLEKAADIHVDLKVIQSLLPFEDSEWIVFPSAMTMLYSYYAIYMTLKEILAEYE